MWIQLLLATEINWTTFNIFLSILINSFVKLSPFIFINLTHVWHHKHGQSTQNSLLLITFLWADSQNSIIFIDSSHMWNMGQTVLSRMFSKYMWLQLWFFNMPFYHKIWEHHTHQDKNIGVFKFAPTQTCVHMNLYMARGVNILVVWMLGHKILQSLNEDGIQICTRYQCYIFPPFGKYWTPLTSHSLFKSIDSLSDISIHLCLFQCK